jgi:hypothetical protein
MTNDQLLERIENLGIALTDARSAAATWRACAEARAAQLDALRAQFDDLRAVRPRIVAGAPAPDGAHAVIIEAADYAAYRAMHEAMKVITKAAQDGRAITDALLYGTGAPAFPARALRNYSPIADAALTPAQQFIKRWPSDGTGPAFPARALRGGDGVLR